MSSAMMSIAAALLLVLKIFADSDISLAYIGLCFIIAGITLILGHQKPNDNTDKNDNADKNE